MGVSGKTEHVQRRDVVGSTGMAEMAEEMMEEMKVVWVSILEPPLGDVCHKERWSERRNGGYIILLCTSTSTYIPYLKVCVCT